MVLMAFWLPVLLCLVLLGLGIGVLVGAGCCMRHCVRRACLRCVDDGKRRPEQESVSTAAMAAPPVAKAVQYNTSPNQLEYT